MPINIEISEKTDAKALSAIHTACFDKGWDADSITQMLSIAGTHAFVAPENAGFAVLRAVAGEAEILTLAVLPTHRRHGLGQALLQAICEWARAHAITTVFLEVRQNNEAALCLYQKKGFNLFSRRKDYYHNTDGSTEDAALLRYTP